jgi:squalene-hopene/tetraprenyl-beta-curcumene cyclase
MQQALDIVSPAAEPTACLDAAIERAAVALMRRQNPAGHWVFELEADATIPAEYVLLNHYLGRSEPALERKIGSYLRRIQEHDGGWPLVKDGASDVSASVKAYFALKMIGDSPVAPHMARARDLILSRGGAAASNVFTRFLMALYGIVPWSATPAMPVEIMLLPRRFPFHIEKISYWSRTVLVPLLVLQALKPRARNPRRIGIDELFVVAPSEIRRWPKGPQANRPWATLFRGLDRALRAAEPHLPANARQQAIAAATTFVTERLNGEDGLGGIFPAMANAEMMFDALGYTADHPHRQLARRAIEKLLCIAGDEAYCQPCLSPVWDTVLTCHALMEVGTTAAHDSVKRGLDWLVPLQILDVRGDWAWRRPEARPGGWAFQYANPHYPDVDDTAAVVLAMDRAQRTLANVAPDEYRQAIDRGQEWVIALQSRNGGWAAFDADNTCAYLNSIPFADHGALLDPPTADVTARCVGMLGQLGTSSNAPVQAAALAYLADEQSRDGSWYGRWGMNYIYGTWSVLSALNGAGLEHHSPSIRRAARWLLACQNADGGWGEGSESYRRDYAGHEPAPSTASQTAWALLGLMAAGEVENPAVHRGIEYLLRTQGADGFWPESRYTATGFPRVFYLRYHGYPKYFPLWALARFRNLRSGRLIRVPHGL